MPIFYGTPYLAGSVAFRGNSLRVFLLDLQRACSGNNSEGFFFSINAALAGAVGAAIREARGGRVE